MRNLRLEFPSLFGRCLATVNPTWTGISLLTFPFSSEFEFEETMGNIESDLRANHLVAQYEDISSQMRLQRGLVEFPGKFSVGDKVKILNDIDKVKAYQEHHGGWNPDMASFLGKIGTVIFVDPEGDLLVSMAGNAYLFNHLSCTKVPQSTAVEEDDVDPMENILQGLFKNLSVQDLDGFVGDAADGNIQNVREFIQKQPSEIDAKCSGMTALHVASRKGHKDIVVMLLEAGANLEMQDIVRNTALHHAVIGNEPEIVELLLSKGANIKAINKQQHSALNVAVLKESLVCVRVLLKHSAPVNIQDSSGDTVLHDAVRKQNERIIDMLINDSSIDFTITNKRGFNVLHYAALKGNNFATERILKKRRDIVDIKKNDGYAALHIATINGYRDVINTLLTIGQAEINIQSLRLYTPLQLAVTRGYIGVIELLISKGANMNVEDDEGDTCLHQAVSDMRVTIHKDSEILKQIHTELNLVGGEPDWLVIACYLVYRGANLYHKNFKDITPLDVVGDRSSKEKLMKFVPKSC